MAKLRKQAEWLEVEHPSAAASLREGLAETFTENRLGLPGGLRRRLGTTNTIENPHGGVPDALGDVLAGGQDGVTMGGSRVVGCGGAFQADHGL